MKSSNTVKARYIHVKCNVAISCHSRGRIMDKHVIGSQACIDSAHVVCAQISS